MRLFIAEKPSLARAIADALPGPAIRKADHIALGDGSIVAWCAGHILETAPPEAYDSRFKSWRLEDLPIAPADWKLVVSATPLLKTLKTLLKSASRVVHAGDPDREGQPSSTRSWGTSATAVRSTGCSCRTPIPTRSAASSRALQPNGDFEALSHAALGRQRADWLYGMNMTRLYTVLAQRAGYRGVLSVGRVQTPLLGAYRAPRPGRRQLPARPHYALTATATTAAGGELTARWQPGDSALPHLDEEKRLVNRPFAEGLRARTTGACGTLTEYTQETKSQPPPLPYSLADLQIDASKRLGLSAQADLGRIGRRSDRRVAQGSELRGHLQGHESRLRRTDERRARLHRGQGGLDRLPR